MVKVLVTGRELKATSNENAEENGEIHQSQDSDSHEKNNEKV